MIALGLSCPVASFAPPRVLMGRAISNGVPKGRLQSRGIILLAGLGGPEDLSRAALGR